jgi:hypothetical protein
MPRTAQAAHLVFPRIHSAPVAGGADVTSSATSLAPADRGFLLQLQRQALEYFLENQTSAGLVLDRQHNHGPRRPHGLCSTTATGMGFIGIALASALPYRLISPGSAAQRVRAGLLAALERLPHDHGMVPHFTHSATNEIHGVDYFSTVETAWLAAGALWAAAFLQDVSLEVLAARFYTRIHWHYWTAPEHPYARGLLRHGKSRDGRFLTCSWDRLNGETAFMYVLAAGAADGYALGANAWEALQSFHGTVAGMHFNNADLGLFVFQYGLDLLDFAQWQAPGTIDLPAEAKLATRANRQACRDAAHRFRTYAHHWGLSSGDGPGHDPEVDAYRCYAPPGPIDGTAHLTATLASVGHEPDAVLQNLREAHPHQTLSAHGRYGFSNINLDRGWVSRDMVGIDIGAVVLALDNYLMDNRVRKVFQTVPSVQRGLERLGFTQRSNVSPAESETAAVRQAS